MAHRLSPAVLALALLSLGGCGTDQIDSLVPTDPLIVIAGPKAFLDFELRDAEDRVIWRLAADQPAAVAELFYGEPPTGFEQQVPAGGGPPRPLVFGEFLSLRSTTPLRVFHHEGFVESSLQLSIDHWEVTLRSPPAPAELDGSPPPP